MRFFRMQLVGCCWFFGAATIIAAFSPPPTVHQHQNHQGRQRQDVARSGDCWKNKPREEAVTIQSVTSTRKDLGISNNAGISRRTLWLMAATATVSPLLLPPKLVLPAVAALPLIMDEGGGIGGGASVRTPLPSTVPDVVYPEFMQGGEWQCQRVVVSVEGNAEQATRVWQALGGGTTNLQPKNNKVETYRTRYIAATPSNAEQNVSSETTTVLDRGFELASRSPTSRNVEWSPKDPNILVYEQVGPSSSAPIAVELAIIQRSVESSSSPNNDGFGFNELVRLTERQLSPAGIPIPRCARVQRRYRTTVTEPGSGRIVEGLEIVKTYRVLDGVAGIELPTSTTKSQIRMIQQPK